MPISFPFKAEVSPIFGEIRRPVAEVFFRDKTHNLWQPVAMLVDTGADYTLLPQFLAVAFGVDLTEDCRGVTTQGVGGTSKVYLLKNKIEAKIGNLKRQIPLGFLDNDYIPPLLGRQEFLETFKVVFEKFHVTFA